MRFSVAPLLVGALIVSGGCASARSPATAAPPPPSAPAQPAAAPASAEDASNVGSVSQQAPLAAAAQQVPSARDAPGDGGTAPGPYFLGQPDAPVVVDEYSDFQ